MTARIGLAIAGLALAAVAIWHPVSRPALQTAAARSPFPDPRAGHVGDVRVSRREPGVDAVVYVAGAVRRPGLYRIEGRERAGDVVAKAGGLAPGADAGGVNLAEHVADGDEVYVPLAGERVTRASGAGRSHGHRRSRRRGAASAPAAASVNLNVAGADELAAVPGIGASIAARIVEVRDRDGAFGSLDELLDVAGMTQTRLERARPYVYL